MVEFARRLCSEGHYEQAEIGTRQRAVLQRRERVKQSAVDRAAEEGEGEAECSGQQKQSGGLQEAHGLPAELHGGTDVYSDRDTYINIHINHFHR